MNGGFSPWGSWENFISTVNMQGFAWQNLLGQDKSAVAWTPAITFQTPGDLAVGYLGRVGRYEKIGRVVKASFNIVTVSFTHTTATGAVLITGLPIASAPGNLEVDVGAVVWAGITNASVTNVVCLVGPGSNSIQLVGCGSAFAGASIAASDMPTGGTPAFSGTVMYTAAR